MPLGTMTWPDKLLHTGAPAYNVNRTDPRGYGENQRVVRTHW